MPTDPVTALRELVEAVDEYARHGLDENSSLASAGLRLEEARASARATLVALEGGERVTLYRNRDGQLLTEAQLPYEHGKHAAERAEYDPVTALLLPQENPQ